MWSIFLVLLVAVAGERTVVVTPRPRWLTQEPRADPSNPSVPSIFPARVPVISLRILPSSPKAALPVVMSAALPMEHRSKTPDLVMDAIPVQQLAAVLRKPVLRPQVVAPFRPIVVVQPTSAPAPAAFTHNSISLANLQQSAPTSLRQAVFVESVPSVSINLDEEASESEEELADYLTPPRYPSVYETVYDAPLPSVPKKKDEKNKLDSIPGIDETSNDISDSSTPDFRKQKPGDRVEFQLHGQAGPKSYKFGFDTGAGIDSSGTKKKTQ
ncbi:uncharacterized protein [Halyomorpha halys]|uniref:uncharacterized protein isoform X2 n=1 Tax=Halyomorpha halys TaxID=286706 RepID=UPI0006D4E6C9